MKLNLNRGARKVSTRTLYYDRCTNKFTGDQSEFYHNSPVTNIYQDSADVGFWLVSHKTNMELPLVHTHTEEDGTEVYKVVPGYLKQNDPRNQITVCLFND